MELEDQIHIIKGSLIDDCLSDLSQFNMVDVLMLERPPSKKNYYSGFYKDLKGHIGDIEVKYDHHKDYKYRVKDLQYCYYKPSMRKVLISWQPRSTEVSYKKNTRWLPFNFAFLSTYMRLKPAWKWTKKQYVSQLKQVEELWKYEDEIMPADYMKVDPLVCVGLLEPDHAEEQLESIREVFKGYNIIFILYDDLEYHKAIRLEGAKEKRKGKVPNLDVYMRNGWTDTRFTGMERSTRRKMLREDIKAKRKGNREALEAARDQYRQDNPLIYLGQLLRGRNSALKGNMKSGSGTSVVDDKIKGWIEYCLYKGVDISEIESLNWFEFKDEFKKYWEE